MILHDAEAETGQAGFAPGGVDEQADALLLPNLNAEPADAGVLVQWAVSAAHQSDGWEALRRWDTLLAPGQTGWRPRSERRLLCAR